MSMAFDSLDQAAMHGLPFDRHEPVRQMNDFGFKYQRKCASRGDLLQNRPCDSTD